MRKEVKWFAEQMESKLVTKDPIYPFGWKKDTAFSLLNSLDYKVLDLEDSLEQLENGIATKEEVLWLAVDVANFAMMIADKIEKDED